MPHRQLILISVLALALTGCGQEDVRADAERELRERTEQIRADVERRADALGESVRARRERIVARIEEVLGDLEQIIPEARVTRPEVQRRAGEQDVEQFLTGVIENVDAYWTRTLKAAGRPEPRVSYVFVEEGRAQRTGCRVVADDRAAFYCPADDTIYVAQRFAADLYAGVLEGLPGGGGQAAGSFGVAYVVAHEYAHNLQSEFDVFRIGRSNSAKPFELQADCLAGTWGNSAFAQGGLTEEDIRQAIATVQSVGDFDVDNEQHHGTPSERRDAWLAGFRSGDPANCTRYVPTV
ncbi:MAG: neutral zinc metallopeptidase [Actinobacteria bacterium]|nr:neutral zinc metallopeptidase [Actinomycetota bacterium]